MIIIPVSERRRIVVGPGIAKDGDEWVDNDAKLRVGYQKIKKGVWVPSKGVQFDKALREEVAKALMEA
jgi:hypothetical protein